MLIDLFYLYVYSFRMSCMIQERVSKVWPNLTKSTMSSMGKVMTTRGTLVRQPTRTKVPARTSRLKHKLRIISRVELGFQTRTQTQIRLRIHQSGRTQLPSRHHNHRPHRLPAPTWAAGMTGSTPTLQVGSPPAKATISIQTPICGNTFSQSGETSRTRTTGRLSTTGLTSTSVICRTLCGQIVPK